PMTLSLWLSLSGTIIALWVDIGIIYYIIFLISILAAMITWFAMLNLLAAKGLQLLTPKNNKNKGLTSKILKYILVALGTCFVLFGLIKIIL
ncbi:MAG: lysine transporter LysE, partial [Clostridium sp.]